MAHQVFISYSSVDAAIAEPMCAALESADISCWIAPRDVQPGTDYPAAIVDALASSIVVVLVLTGHAVASPHILTEIGHAFNDRKRIVPFRIASVPLSKDLDYFLSMAQWLDARDGCTDENLKRLVGAVKSALQGEVPVKPAPLYPERKLAFPGDSDANCHLNHWRLQQPLSRRNQMDSAARIR